MKPIQIVIVVAFLVSSALHAEVTFIPASPLTEKEIRESNESLRDELGWDEEDIAAMFGDDAEMFTYRESDIREALGTIKESDAFLYHCSNSMMGGASVIAFVEETDIPNQIKVKTTPCRNTDGGLSCFSTEIEKRYRYNDIFFTTNGLNFEEAIEIISTFESHGIDGLPDWYRRVFGVQSVSSIEKTLNGFLIGVGDIYCGGCVAKLLITINRNNDSEIDRLSFVDAIGGICI